MKHIKIYEEFVNEANRVPTMLFVSDLRKYFSDINYDTVKRQYDRDTTPEIVQADNGKWYEASSAYNRWDERVVKLKSVKAPKNEQVVNEAAKLKSLYDNIYSTSMDQNGAYSYVVYLDGKKPVSIGSYKDVTPYAAQVTGDNEFKVTFGDTKNRTQIIFTTNVDARKEDRDSYNKYGGLIYIFEPITDKLANEIMKKVPTLNK